MESVIVLIIFLLATAAGFAGVFQSPRSGTAWATALIALGFLALAFFGQNLTIK